MTAVRPTLQWSRRHHKAEQRSRNVDKGSSKSFNAAIRCQRTLLHLGTGNGFSKAFPSPLGSATTVARIPCSLPTITDGLPSTPPGEAFPPHPFLSSTPQNRKQIIIPALLPWDSSNSRDLYLRFYICCVKPHYQHQPGHRMWRTITCQAGHQHGKTHTPSAREGLQLPTLALLLHPQWPFTTPRTSCVSSLGSSHRHSSISNLHPSAPTTITADGPHTAHPRPRCRGWVPKGVPLTGNLQVGSRTLPYGPTAAWYVGAM